MSLDYLAKKNAHPRDAFIQFEEATHVYTVHGDRTFMSVTTWNHHHFPKFDADKIIKQIISSRKHKTDPEYKYYMMTAGQILDMWNANRDGAASSGTNMHYDIECYYNRMDVKNDSVEYRYFQNFLRENPDLHPYRTEWTIYHEELKIAGSVDMVYENPDGTLLIYDWKRCKEIVKVNAYGGKALTPCIQHLEDTNFWHYALQLNTYKAIIEEKYGRKVVGLCLVCLHPNNADYQLIEVPFLEKELADLFAYRKQMLLDQKQAHGKAVADKALDKGHPDAVGKALDKGHADAVGKALDKGHQSSSSSSSSIKTFFPVAPPATSQKGKGLLLDLNNL